MKLLIICVMLVLLNVNAVCVKCLLSTPSSKSQAISVKLMQGLYVEDQTAGVKCPNLITPNALCH